MRILQVRFEWVLLNSSSFILFLLVTGEVSTAIQLEKNSNKLISSIILMLILLSAHFSYAMLGSFLHLKGTVSRDIYFLIFFCSTNPSVPLIDMLKYIRMWLQFCGDIRVKSWNFWRMYTAALDNYSVLILIFFCSSIGTFHHTV